MILDVTDRLKDDDANHSHVEPFLRDVVESLSDLSREEIIKRFLSLQSSAVMEDYLAAPDLNVREVIKDRTTRHRKNGPPAKGPSRMKFARFSINVGKKDGVHPTRLIGEINEATGSSRIRIGKIEIRNKSALLEADSRFAPQILGAFRRRMINGKPVCIEMVGGAAKSRIA